MKILNLMMMMMMMVMAVVICFIVKALDGMKSSRPDSNNHERPGRGHSSGGRSRPNSMDGATYEKMLLAGEK